MTHCDFFIKKVYLGLANLMIHNHMSHNQAKNGYLVLYRAAIDFEMSKKIFQKAIIDLFEDKKDRRKHFLIFSNCCCHISY